MYKRFFECLHDCVLWLDIGNADADELWFATQRYWQKFITSQGIIKKAQLDTALLKLSKVSKKRFWSVVSQIPSDHLENMRTSVHEYEVSCKVKFT